MLKATYHSKYNTINKNNQPTVVFRYIVSGTESELADYKTAVGDKFRPSDDGRPFFFSTAWNGDVVNLGIAQKTGKVYMDTAPLDKLNSLVSRYPGALGNAMAQLGAAQILGNLGGSRPIAAVAPNVTQQQEQADPGVDLDQQ
jgi:hypothetical protein